MINQINIEIQIDRKGIVSTDTQMIRTYLHSGLLSNFLRHLKSGKGSP